MKKRYLVLFLLAALAGFIAYRYLWLWENVTVGPAGTVKPKEKPLLSYTFDALKKTEFKQGAITLGKPIAITADTVEQVFYFSAPSRPGGNPDLKVSGVVNLPKKPGTYPVIVMFRGFIPEESYAPGAGTQHVAEVLARQGYITLAPDFLGFGESDKPSSDSFEARFQTYTTALSLIASLPNLNSGLDASYSGSLQADTGRVGIWGHSNGGHIALAVLAITGAGYPSVLWAPVSKSFPYSILYYTDEADDQGKAMRRVLSGFEQDYDTAQFSPDAYYSWIKAPLELAQGTADREVPVWWSDDLETLLKKENIDLTYHTYPGADHNMLPSGWSDAVGDSVSFYRLHLQ